MQGQLHPVGCAGCVAAADNVAQYDGHRVRAGAHQRAVVPGRAAGYPLQLPDDIIGFNAGPQRQRSQAGNRFQQRRIAAARLPHRSEYLKGFPGIVQVDRNIHIAVSGADALRDALNLAGTPPRRPDARNCGVIIGIGCRHCRRSVPGAQHLVGLAAVAVHRDAFAAQRVGRLVRFRYIVHRGVLGKVDGLGYGIVGIGLERRLHPHVPLRADVVRHPEHFLDPARHRQIPN